MAKTKKRKPYYEVYEVETIESLVWGCSTLSCARKLAAKYNKETKARSRSDSSTMNVRFVVKCRCEGCDARHGR